MRYTIAIVVTLLAGSIFANSAFASPAGQEPADGQTPSFRAASSELVVLPVIVTDHPDHFVRDLTLDNFSVYDNDRRVPLELFSKEDTPVTVGLVIDSSSSMRHKLGEVMAAVMAFARSSNPQDELFAISFNDGVRELIPNGQFLPASDLAGLNRALMRSVAEGRTSLYDALIQGLDRLAAGTRPRRVLILISDGGDNASTATLDQVLAKARASNAAIYSIGLFDDLDLEKNPRVLKSIAKATGGERYLPATAGPLMSACEHIAREVRSGFTLGFVPPERDGAYHRVRVEVSTADRRKLAIRTRPGYFASRQTTEPQP
jgi:VWFA-related protein